MKKNILEYLLSTVQKYPERLAVIEGEKSITFKELDNKARILAQHLILNSDVINRPVAVYLAKTINSVVADIAISYSGNAYMNLDIKTPSERIRNILDLIEPQFIITDTRHLKLLDDISSEKIIINIDELDFENPAEFSYDLSRLNNLIDTDPLCIINTSGSTGTPKGVVLNHRSFIDFTDWSLDTFNFSENEIIGSLSPLVFDIYSFELCMLMSVGSTIVLIPDGLSAFPIRILNLISEQRVTFLFWVPTIMVNMANMNLLSALEFPDLKVVWFAGEVFPTKQFNYWKRNLPNTLFANLYGPIEITLDCTYFIINRTIEDYEPLPIGFPCRNTDVLILNEFDELITEGEEGELCVRGTSLAMGYYNNPEKTAAAFVQNPLNKSYPELIYRTGDIVSRNHYGEIVFKGRKDTLVKHLGYRVELGEIEHVIVNTLKMASNGCVVYDFREKNITLFYEAVSEISAADFRKRISTVLPKYMIPTVFVRMDQLPRNTNGKIDRLTLKNLIEANDSSK